MIILNIFTTENYYYYLMTSFELIDNKINIKNQKITKNGTID